MEETKLCKICGMPALKCRRYCNTHYLERRKEFYKKSGRWLKWIKCRICGKDIKSFDTTRNRKYCVECFNKTTSDLGNVTNNYEKAGGKGYSFKHRRIAEEILNRKLEKNEVVHHLDENPLNNSPQNLIILSRSDHVKLHRHLQAHRATLEESKDVNIENCWNTLRASLTTTWLETAGVMVIKLVEIGQSAAEPLSQE